MNRFLAARIVRNYTDEDITSLVNMYKSLPDDDTREWFTRQAEHCKRFNKKVSRNGINLAIKIRKQLDAIVFPYIAPVARRGWGTDGGTWAWSMNLYPFSDVGSGDKVAMCLRKSYALVWIGGAGGNELCAEKLSRKADEEGT